MISIRRAETDDDIEKVGVLWSEYWESLGLPLTFQGFGEQLRSLPGEFVLLIAHQDSDVAGTVALRPLRASACEVKRLYVPARFRGHGLGRKLLRAAIADARQTGYSEMYCDTLLEMKEAAKLYDGSGFTRVEPYSDHPTPGAIYFKLVLGHGAA